MIQIINATKNPIQFMGKVAGICYNADIKDSVKNYKRGLKCVKDNHGRVLEFADVTMVLDEYSARAMRELYTHIIGTSRLQASTRYIEYSDFDYYTPDSLYDDEDYHRLMKHIMEGYKQLVDKGISKEDVANLLPLGMHSTVVLKINYRALLHLAEMRLCSRAYTEIQEMMKSIIIEVSKVDNEWLELMKYMKPKCKICTEKHNCKK